MHKPAIPPAVGIALIYVLIAGLWILLSDQVLGALVESAPVMISAQTIEWDSF